MANPFQHGSSGVPPILTGSPVPPIRSSHASVVSGTSPSTASSQIPPFNRLSHILNPPHDVGSELYAQHPIHRSTRYGVESEGNAAAADSSGLSGGRPRPPQLPSISRAFEMFVNTGAADNFWATQHRNNGFFAPSYLQGTMYIQRLEEAHKAKQAQKEVQQQAVGGGGGLQTGQTPVPSKPATHLGIAYDLIERPPIFDEDDTIAPLPTRWSRDDKHGGLEVMGEGQEVKYTQSKQPGERDYEMCAIRSDHAVPPQAGLYYFEITVLSRKRDETTVCIGFTQKSVSLSRPPGWEPESYGYHGDDGHAYSGHNVGKTYGHTYTSGDTVGCGINFRTGTAFFTKNGLDLGIAFRDVKGKLYPTISLKRHGEHIRVNFGQTPFVFDIDGRMKQEQVKIRKAIAETSTEKLTSPPLNETDLIQQLVLQFLQHDGYVETARAFAEEIRTEKQALSLDPNDRVEGINIVDDEDANRRQRIRRAILEGDIDKALKYTNLYYPHVLQENEQVYFRLRCRKFIEMVRKSAEVSSGPKSNGHSVEDMPNEMDLDENGYTDKMETEDGLDGGLGDHESILLATIQYGKSLQEEFKGDPRREVSKALGDVFSLLAYQDPFQAKEVAHLLDRRGRIAVAEELNSAILMSLGKSSRSALENLYGQTGVLLDYLREEGGPGSFVTVQSIVDEIPKSQSF